MFSLKSNLIILLSLLFACTNNSKTEDQKSKIEINRYDNPYINSRFDIEVIENKDHTFGYNIYVNQKLMINQPNIPAISGNQGFSNAEKARKTAGFICNKIRNNQIPPTVSVQELDSLNVLK